MSSVKASHVDLSASAGHGMSIADLLGHDLSEAQTMDVDGEGSDPPAKSSSVTKKTQKKSTAKTDTVDEDGNPVTPTPKKRAPKAPAVDADGNAIAPKKRTPKAPAVDADGNAIPPKKRAPKTPAVDADGNAVGPKKRGPKASAVAADDSPAMKFSDKKTPQKDEEVAEDAADGHGGSNGSAVKTKTSKAVKAGDKAIAKSETVNDQDDTEVEGDEGTVAEPVTPEVAKTPQTPKTSANRKAKKETDNTMGPPSSTKPSSKKRGMTAEPGEIAETPTKKPRKAPQVGPGRPSKIPTSEAELSDVDKLILKMKKDNCKWAEIEQAISQLKGEEVVKGSLNKRYARVMASITEWKDGDIERMLHVMNLVEKDTAAGIEAFKRKAEQEKWAKAAELMLTVGGDKYTAGALEKRYAKEKREGFPHRNTVDQVMAGKSKNAEETEDGVENDSQEAEVEDDGEEDDAANGDVDSNTEMVED